MTYKNDIDFELKYNMYSLLTTSLKTKTQSFLL